jgi:hypothetical protein
MLEIFAAFLAAISASEPWPVYDWSDPALAQDEKPTRYIAVADFTPARHNPRLSGHRGVSGHLFAVTIVGETMTEVRAASDAIRDRIEGDRLTAGTGETETTPLFQDDANQQPVTVLEDTSNPRLFTTVELWRCTSTRV